MPRPAIDIAGKRFGNMVALERLDRKSNGGGATWMCRCDCGKRKIVKSQNLRNGSTQSCGCGLSRKTRPRKKRHDETCGQPVTRKGKP